MNRHSPVALLLLTLWICLPWTSQARWLAPSVGRFQTMDTFEGRPSDPQSLHKYLYCHDDPVNMVDQSGHDPGASAPGQLTLMGGIHALASQSLGAVSRAYVATMLNMPRIMYVGEQVLFWTGVGSAGLTLAADAMEWSANFSESLNRKFAHNTIPIVPGPGPRGFQVEGLVGQAIQETRGEYLGGNVSGIDGVAKVPSGRLVLQARSHDLPIENLKREMENGMTRLSQLDLRTVHGTTGPGANDPGVRYRMPRGADAGRIYVVGVPANQARAIIDPSFIQWLRAASERTRTLPIIGAINNWRGRAR